jgi:flagellar hook protein FlgE
VERLQARTAFSANAAVVRTADEMTGALLDMLA